MKTGIAGCFALTLVSCATAPPVRLAIVRFEIRHAVARTAPAALDRVAEDHLADRLVSSGRLQVVHRPSQFSRPAGTGPVAAADWVLCGSIEPTTRGSFDADPPECVCEVFLHARVIRSVDGLILYSKRHRGTAAGRPGSEIPRLADEAARLAAGSLAIDLIALTR